MSKSRGKHAAGDMSKPTNQQPAAGQEAARNAHRSLRNQIRGVQRLLKRDLDADVRAVQEAKLAELLAKQESKEASERERKMALRYRKVRSTWSLFHGLVQKPFERVMHITQVPEMRTVSRFRRHRCGVQPLQDSKA
jgi:rRNA-processing protein Efg1